MLKTYQREIKLFEFLRDTNSEELKTKKSNVTLQWLYSIDLNYFIAITSMSLQ